jgi:phosphopantetheinyl transferase (holo-ACP synthase)
MIGNDIVDLGDAETGDDQGRHPRFDARVFTPIERAMLAASPDRDRRRWFFWAAKESAYKAMRRADPRTIFSPSRFQVDQVGAARATVRVGGRRLRVAFVAEERYVHALASLTGDPAELRTAVGALPSGASPSEAVRELAIANVAAALGIPSAELTIRRQGRIPTLWHRGCPAPMPVSLSHHGRFVAFACAVHPRDEAA